MFTSTKIIGGAVLVGLVGFVTYGIVKAPAKSQQEQSGVHGKNGYRAEADRKLAAR